MNKYLHTVASVGFFIYIFNVYFAFAHFVVVEKIPLHKRTTGMADGFTFNSLNISGYCVYCAGDSDSKRQRIFRDSVRLPYVARIHTT